jgi:hypothetical protein
MRRDDANMAVSESRVERIRASLSCSKANSFHRTTLKSAPQLQSLALTVSGCRRHTRALRLTIYSGQESRRLRAYSRKEPKSPVTAKSYVTRNEGPVSGSTRSAYLVRAVWKDE